MNNKQIVKDFLQELNALTLKYHVEIAASATGNVELDFYNSEGDTTFTHKLGTLFTPQKDYKGD